jgi:diguanylate cyclase (GGDEF)-like protein/PAS domain S-box-containing protein
MPISDVNGAVIELNDAQRSTLADSHAMASLSLVTPAPAPKGGCAVSGRRSMPTGRTLPEKEWQRRHRGVLAVLWALTCSLPLYGLVRGHALSHHLVITVCLLLVTIAASRLRGRRTLASLLASYGLFLASALAVHLANGATEAHFMFFVMIIIVSLYEDWRPFLVAFAFVVLHHGLMGILDRASVYDHPGNPWVLALVHGGFVAAAGIACVVSWRCNEGVRADWIAASERARDSDARFRSAFEDGPIGMALVETTAGSLGTLLQVNRTLCQRFGYSRSELAGADLGALLSPGSASVMGHLIERLVAGDLAVAHEELRLVRQDGRGFEGHVSMSLVAGVAGSRDLIVQIVDDTERNRLKDELQDLADHDPLTGLVNRRRFGVKLAHQLAARGNAGADGAVVLIDLDGFKEINDTLGHEAGDRLLVSVAATLRDSSRAQDTVARLGGDEFALLINGAGPSEAKRIGQRMVRRVHERARTGHAEHTRRATASVGIVAYSAHTELTADALLNDADLAMYEAKDNGGNRCVLYRAEPGPGAGDSAPSWPDRIRHALDEECLAMYAQPILELGCGQITHYELLLRMIGSDGEVILPGAFLPVAERRGMIRTIDRWVISQAAGLLAAFPYSAGGGPGPCLQVNISGRSLSDADFLVYIRTQLARSGGDPARLVFEITETAAIANVDDACNFLTSLSELGCGIALDDFGAGFGSLHYLKNLPVDFLKIDGQFIKSLTTNPDDLVVVDSLVRLARGLRMRTTAECVEDAGTLKLIGDLGVDFAQGYHVGRPGPARQVIAASQVVLAGGADGTRARRVRR